MLNYLLHYYISMLKLQENDLEMQYNIRHAEARLRLLADNFKVILVNGARQVGKSTLLSHVFPDVKSIVFDPVQDIYGARQDPDLFLDNFPAPIILDEIQYVPELLPAIKRRVDLTDAKGQYIMTGSQNLSVLKSVAESMAGRVGILELDAMTWDELQGAASESTWLNKYLENPAGLPEIFNGCRPAEGGLARTLWRGSMPGLLGLSDMVVPDYYRSYVQTYVERDVRLVEDIRELLSFSHFLSLAAALTAQELNASQLGREVSVSPMTSRRWLDLLSTTFQWRELFPYSGNTIKRVSGKRKGYLRDTGLACYLQRLSSPEALAASPLFGAMFETWVVNSIHRMFVTLPLPPQAYHWRTSGGAEVALILDYNNKLYPIEVKCKTNLNGNDTRGLKAFVKTYSKNNIADGLIIYAGTECYKVREGIWALPWNAIVSDV